jgi:twinkle protein
MKVFSDNDFANFLESSNGKEFQHIGSASNWTDGVIKRLNGDISMAGECLPWSKTHNKVQLRPGEVSIWGGYNGHGKSQVLGQVCAWNLHKKWLIASMEMKPEATLARMLRQVSGCRLPDDGYVQQFLKSTNDKLWIYDQQDTVKQDRILIMMFWAAKILDIDHIVIDSLMKCGVGREDYEQQARFVDKICWMTKNENFHTHIVHHMRKGEHGEGKIPTKHDFRGAGELTDLVDNVFIQYRNKPKEEKIAVGAVVADDVPDAFLKIVKQRHGEWEGSFKLWFNHESMQYTPDNRNRPIPYPR